MTTILDAESRTAAQPRRATGILPAQQLRGLIEEGRIRASVPMDEAQVQPASLDVRLGPVAHRVQASFLPSRSTSVSGRLQDLGMHVMDLSRPVVLERQCVYLIPLLEELDLPTEYAGRANPKSSTGRLDVFTRLLTEHGEEFDLIPNGYRGPLYLEVVPRAFSVVVRQGCRLSQVRFLKGNPRATDSQLTERHNAETLLYSADDAPAAALISNGLWVSVDLRPAEGTGVVGYRARPHAPAVDVERIGAYDPRDFWEPIVPGESGYLILNPGDFYILASKERVSVPPDMAAEMVCYDSSVGEFRVHYAGFFDPGFGYGGDDLHGTRAVLEVRSHEVPFLLEDGQRVGRLLYERMLSLPDKLYGLAIGSSYQRQGLALSKQFRPY